MTNVSICKHTPRRSTFPFEHAMKQFMTCSFPLQASDQKLAAGELQAYDITRITYCKAVRFS